MNRRQADRGIIDAGAAGIGLAAFAVLPYAFSGGASGLGLLLQGRWTLLLIVAGIVAAGGAAALAPRQTLLRLAGPALALVLLFTVGWLDGPASVSWGPGTAVLAAVSVLLLARAAASAGAFKADRWVATVTVAILASVLLFVFFPVAKVLTSAFVDKQGALALGLFAQRFFAPDIWSLACLISESGCGVVANTIWLGLLTGLVSTALGLAFALLATRGGMKNSKLFDALSILPIITPPFVIALALVILFGRTGIITTFMDDWFGIPRSRWIYGLP
ncbi:MAG: iron ABC transporter permease, partial [Bosea sp. (in: a-proteobacteria)]